MSGQGYKRTNFDDEEPFTNGGTSSTQTADFHPGIVFRGGLTKWQRKTLTEKVLFILLAILTLVIVILACLLAAKESSLNNSTKSPKKPDVCVTPDCVMVAGSVLQSLDRTVDPCDDFYNYACGGWVKKHPIPAGHFRWGTFSVLQQENQVIMKNMVEKPISSIRSQAQRKAIRFYESCMDKNKTVEKLGAKPLNDLIKRLNVTPPEDWSDWDYQTRIENVQLLDISVLFSIWVGVDDKNSSRNILQIDEGGLGLPNRDYYINKTIGDDKVLKAYETYMFTIRSLLNDKIKDDEKNESKAEIREIIEFEMKIANITTPESERRDREKLYHKTTIGVLQQKYPVINWLQLINRALSGAGTVVTDKEEVICYSRSFFANLNSLLQEMLQTDDGKRILNSYLVWHVQKNLESLLSEPFRTAEKKMDSAITGVSGVEETWRTCISSTNGILGLALGAMFVTESFKGESKIKAEKMIEEVKTAFKKNLPNLSWMDKETAKAAIDKANAVIDMIGFPDYILNTTRLDEEYEGLIVKSDEYFQNTINSMKFSLLKNVRELRKKPKKNKWEMNPSTVNAYYTPSKNEIVFPAGILQAPFFDITFPKSLNFGAMGVVMGHELTHGFDDQGREYDKDGNLNPWWKNESIAKFKEQTKCMIDQYSSYKVNGENVRTPHWNECDMLVPIMGHKVDGKQTLGENIADNGGLNAAFNAYEQWVQKNGEELPLPGLNLTHRQLFFLGFSQVWCSRTTKEADHLQISKDSHCPDRYRVIGTLSNSKMFSKHYNCPAGAKMNPRKKCVVW